MSKSTHLTVDLDDGRVLIIRKNSILVKSKSAYHPDQRLPIDLPQFGDDISEALAKEAIQKLIGLDLPPSKIIHRIGALTELARASLPESDRQNSQAVIRALNQIRYKRGRK